MTVLNKRAYDERILHVDLSPVLRDDDTVQTVTSIDALLHVPNDADNDIVVTNISPHDRAVSFKVAGGTAGQSYTMRIRFTTNSGVGQVIEGIVRLDVQ